MNNNNKKRYEFCMKYIKLLLLTFILFIRIDIKSRVNIQKFKRFLLMN